MLFKHSGKPKPFVRRTRRKGASLLEGGLLIGLIAIGAIGAVFGVGEDTRSVFCRADSSIRHALSWPAGDCPPLFDLAEGGVQDPDAGGGGGQGVGGEQDNESGGGGQSGGNPVLPPHEPPAEQTPTFVLSDGSAFVVDGVAFSFDLKLLLSSLQTTFVFDDPADADHAGLTLTSSGILSGTKSGPGAYSFDIVGTRTNGAVSTATFVLTVNACDPNDLTVGDVCTIQGQQVFYGGNRGGYKLFFLYEEGSIPYKFGQLPTDRRWSTTTGTSWLNTSNLNSRTGVQNTDSIVRPSNPRNTNSAAWACRQLGADWFLPSQRELQVAITSGNNEGFGPVLGNTWTSNENAPDDNPAYAIMFSGGSFSERTKNTSAPHTCAIRFPE